MGKLLNVALKASKKAPMGLIRAASILAIDNRFRTWSLELKCLGTSFGGAKQKFGLVGTQHGRRVIKAYLGVCTLFLW